MVPGVATIKQDTKQELRDAICVVAGGRVNVDEWPEDNSHSGALKFATKVLYKDLTFVETLLHSDAMRSPHSPLSIIDLTQDQDQPTSVHNHSKPMSFRAVKPLQGHSEVCIHSQYTCIHACMNAHEQGLRSLPQQFRADLDSVYPGITTVREFSSIEQRKLDEIMGLSGLTDDDRLQILKVYKGKRVCR